MARVLPDRPDLDHLKKQAQRLLSDFQRGDASAAVRFAALTSPPEPPTAKLADAQHVVAREFGFANWAALKEHIASMAQRANPMDALEAAIRSSSADRVRTVLTELPELKGRLDEALPGAGFGATPLIVATHYASRDIVDVLLDAGANIDQRSHWWAGGFGVLDDDRGLAGHLIARGATLDANAAAKLGRLDALREIVGHNPDAVHARGGDGQTPLHVAASVEIAEFLLDHGAALDTLDVDHESTPAQYMIRERQDVVRLLISRGCHTDILMAAALGDDALVRAHLDSNPGSLRISVDKEWFPMRNPRAGGTIYIWTLGNHATPHAVARSFGHDDIFAYLMKVSPPEVKLAQVCELGDERMFGEMLAANPNIARTLSPQDRMKLVAAAEQNNATAVRLMLAAGWPVDSTGPTGETALHFAAWHGNVEMVREILRYRPPLELRDSANKVTPINWAVHGSQHGWHRDKGDYGATVTALLDAGAVPPAIGNDSWASDAILRALAARA